MRANCALDAVHMCTIGNFNVIERMVSKYTRSRKQHCFDISPKNLLTQNWFRAQRRPKKTGMERQLLHDVICAVLVARRLFWF